MIWFYQLCTRVNTMETCGITATFLVATAASFLLGPENIWFAVIMLVMSAVAVVASVEKLRQEMGRAEAGYHYNKELAGQRIRFLTPRHVLDVLLPLSLFSTKI